MDTRTKEIMDNFINNKLDTNDSFRFHCTKCGKCCIDRDDILLSALDLFRISKYLKQAPTDVFRQYCEWYIGTDHGSRSSGLNLQVFSGAARS